MKELRANKTLVDENGQLISNVEFDNLSRAACFVAGYSVNGRDAWKTENGRSVKEYLEANK